MSDETNPQHGVSYQL